MMTLDISELTILERQHYLQHAIAPRPICFASTIDSSGNVNLSPFSFFNLFSIHPPIVIFSPSRRVRDNTVKHTLQNVLAVPEVVINIVDTDMIHQTSLASCEYPPGVNEFIKAGFTEQPADLVRPPMVKESRIKLECKVIEVKALGHEAGAGNLVLCEVLRIHIDESLLDDKKRIDQRKIHHVARLGGDWYCSVNESNLFSVAKPNKLLGMGMDALPVNIRKSKILTGNDLGRLAGEQEIPLIDPAFEDDRVRNIFQYYAIDPDELEIELHRYARELLQQGRVAQAWQVLISG